MNFIKEDTFNEDYDLQLRKQTTTEQLRNLRDTMREVKDEAADGKTCPVADEDASKQSRIEFTYINDVTLENAEVLQVQSQSYTPYETFVYGVNRISRRTYKDKMNYYQYDGRGSVIGQQKQQNSDDLYYKITYNDFGKSNRKLDDEYGFNGESHDYNGSQYLRARFYDTNTGRFDARDTYLGDKEDPISQNRYAYVWNNPSKYTDPSGHMPGTYTDAGGTKRNLNQGLIQFRKSVRNWQADRNTAKVGEYCAQYEVAVRFQYNRTAEGAYCRYALRYQLTRRPSANECAYKNPYADNNNNNNNQKSDAEIAIDKLQETLKKYKEQLKQMNVNPNDLKGMSDEEKIRYLEELIKICEKLKSGEIDVNQAKKDVDALIPKEQNEEAEMSYSEEKDAFLTAIMFALDIIIGGILGKIFAWLGGIYNVFSSIFKIVVLKISTWIKELLSISNAVLTIVADIGLTLLSGGAKFAADLAKIGIFVSSDAFTIINEVNELTRLMKGAKIIFKGSNLITTMIDKYLLVSDVISIVLQTFF